MRENRDVVVTVRFTSREAEALRKTADRQGLSMSAYVRKKVKRRLTLDRALAIFLAVMWVVFIIAVFAAFMAAVGCTLLGMPWGCS